MADFKDTLKEVEDAVMRDVGTTVAFRDLLEDLASLLNDIDENTQIKVRPVDILILVLLSINMLTTLAVYLNLIHTM